MALQNISINIEKIIKNNKISKEYNVIKDMEDKIVEIYQKNNDTEFLNENKMGFLYEINDNYCSIKFHKNLQDVLSHFKLSEQILNNKDKLVFTGSAIRSILSPKETYRKEIFITGIEDINWNTIIPNLDSFEQTDNIYFKKTKGYIINLVKTIYSTPSEVILNGPYIKRFGLYLDKLYATPMFIFDYNLKIKYVRDDFIDPVLNTPLDLFDLEYSVVKNESDIFDVINKKEYDALLHITSYDLNKIKNNMTCIEYALDLYVKEECEIIQNQLKLIIYELLKHVKFRRNPGFFAELIKLDNYDLEMYEILVNPEYIKLRQHIQPYKNIEELNISILNYYILNDLVDDFYMYIKILCKKPSSEIFKTIIDTNPKKIISEGIKKKYFSDYNIYKIILLSQQLNYINEIQFDINIAVNFLDKIVENCLTKSFYYLYKHDSTIINTLNANNQTLLHQIQYSKSDDLIEDMIRLLITLDEKLLFKKDISNNTPLLHHAINNNYKITEILIKIIKQKNLKSLFEEKNDDNNNILHVLTKSNSNIRLIKEIIYDNLQLLNLQNINGETALIISCKNSAEDIYYLLNGLNADTDITDKYGNIVDHYICQNEICIGMAIRNKENIFGFTPSDYCKISNKYYYFIDKF